MKKELEHMSLNLADLELDEIERRLELTASSADCSCCGNNQCGQNQVKKSTSC
jgi:hypothetical protein